MLKADTQPQPTATVSRSSWPHQIPMLRYTFQRRHPVIFVDPRMGKTKVFIQRAQGYKPLDLIRGLRILVVTPNSAMGSWTEELMLAGQPWYQVLEGSRQRRLEKLHHACQWNLAHPDIHLSLPEIADTDIVNWDCVCLDESTSIKNYRSRRSRFWVNHFRDCPHRWVMTGTPNPEHLLEFWPQLAFCDGHAFGHSNYWQARQDLCALIDHDWVVKPSKRVKVHEYIAERAYILRREDVNLEPEKQYVQRPCQLPKQLAKVYRKIEREFLLELDADTMLTTMWAGARYTWMRQLAGGFINGKLVCDAKLQELTHLLESDYHSEHVVIWAAYLPEIEAIADALGKMRKVGVLTGAVPPGIRRHIVKEFNQNKLDILVIQHQIGETGMRLSSADVAIYYSNPAGNLARQQTEDRIVHLGKIDRVLTYIDLIMQDTVDSDVSTALKCKRRGSDMTIEAIVQARMKLRHED